MSLQSRKEYIGTMRRRYQETKSKTAKSGIIDEVVEVLEYHRKYAIQALNGVEPSRTVSLKRHRPVQYSEALPTIQTVWEALDYPCAERLHPVLCHTAELLKKYREIAFGQEVAEQLSRISCSEIPIECYAWNEDKPGALEIDLVEHNGGSSLGHFAYTLSVVDIVSGFSRRRAVLGRGQAGVHRELGDIINQWPFHPWGLHSDNGSEFLSDQLLRFCRQNGLSFTRGRPYHKNDNAHVEQKNRQYVREIVGYERFDTPEAVEWLNQVYGLLDTYANLFLPMRKVVYKQRKGTHISKRYDAACAPLERLVQAGVLSASTEAALNLQVQDTNPLALHRQLERLLLQEPSKNTILRDTFVAAGADGSLG
ncbi:MAG: transposase [Bacillota bacterium]